MPVLNILQDTYDRARTTEHVRQGTYGKAWMVWLRMCRAWARHTDGLPKELLFAGGREYASVMRNLLLPLTLLAAAVSLRAQPLAFEPVPETLRVPVVSHISPQPDAKPEVAEVTILGKFYPQGNLPVIRAGSATVDPGQSPYALLSVLLREAQNAGEDAVRGLYSPESQEIILELSANPELRQRHLQWLESLQSFTILGGWAEAPNRYVLYTRVNAAQSGVMPFLFERLGGRWYLRAGRLASPLSSQLDAVYFSPVPMQVEVISPAAPQAARALLEQSGMADLAVQLGVVLPETDSGK